MSATCEIDSIKSIKILSGTCATGAPVITDKKDMEFLQKYTFSHDRTDKRENWDGWLNNNSDYVLVVYTETQGEYYLYLIKDGNIAIQWMSGDSKVPEITYDFYTADEENQLTKEKLETF